MKLNIPDPYALTVGAALGISEERKEVFASRLDSILQNGETTSRLLAAMLEEAQTLEEAVFCTFMFTKRLGEYFAMQEQHVTISLN